MTILKNKKKGGKLLKYRIMRYVLLSIFIVAAIVLITHFAGSSEINKNTARLVCFALYR